MIVVVTQDPPFDFEMILSSGELSRWKYPNIRHLFFYRHFPFPYVPFLFLISHSVHFAHLTASSDFILNEPCMYFYTHIRITYYIHYITISTHRNYIQYHYHRAVLSFSV
jgi:hypothetical protein